MVLVVLRYPAYLPDFDEVAERCRAMVPIFERDIPGLIDKTWGMNEEAGTMCSVYHFEDRASADARFATDRFRDFVENTLQSQLEMEFFDVAAVAARRPLK
ncbi:MAG: hypothetical protein HKN95_12925 [Acidimicrobiia bacterium]|nr:hypothetical protein [Acidimicrobiia bacterium]